jgi:C4-dicarboxylate-specific signal transduction histidine kinase
LQIKTGSEIREDGSVILTTLFEMETVMRNWKFLAIPMMVTALGAFGCTKTKKEAAEEGQKEIRNEQKDVMEEQKDVTEAQREAQKDINEEKKDVIEAQKDVEKEKVEAQKEINQAPQ